MIKTLIDFFGFAKEVNTNKFDRKKGDELIECETTSGVPKGIFILEYANRIIVIICIVSGILFFIRADVILGSICLLAGFVVIIFTEEPTVRIGKKNNKSFSEKIKHEPISNLVVLNKKEKIVELLLKCPSIQSAGDRQAIVGELPDYIKNKISESGNSRIHVLSIVNICLDHPGGFDMFIEQLRYFDGETIAFQELIDFVKKSPE